MPRVRSTSCFVGYEFKKEGAISWQAYRARKRGHLIDSESVGELHGEIVRPFIKRVGADGKNVTFQMVINVRSPQDFPFIQLFAGRSLMRLNPQDWRGGLSLAERKAILTQAWKWGSYKRFQDIRSVEAANQYGIRLFRPFLPDDKAVKMMEIHGPDREVVGIDDPMPRSAVHFKMFCSDNSYFMPEDPSSSGSHDWLSYFLGAVLILTRLGIEKRPTRYIVHCGPGVTGPGTLNVLSYDGFMPKLFPREYNFPVANDGTITTTASAPHQLVIDMIDKWNSIAGFSMGEIELRRKINREIFAALKELE